MGYPFWFFYKPSKNCEQLFYKALHCKLNILTDGVRGFNKITSVTGRHIIPLLSSWENGMKQVHDADEFKEACS